MVLTYSASAIWEVRYRGVRVAPMLGQESMVDAQVLLLQHEACTVPAGVLKCLRRRGD
jgi:hypothetical protein